MRILHTADLHLGRQFMGLSLEEDHEAVLGQILETLVVERADVLVIAGDIFDRASPPNSSIRQFNRFLKRVAEESEAAVVMISGNHDSGDRIEAMSVFSTASRVLVRGIADAVEAPLVLRDEHGEIAFSALPFSYEYAAREVFGDESISAPADVIAAQIAAARGQVPEGARWVVVAHAFVAGGAVGETERALTRVGSIETVPSDVFDGADYVALGHLHKPQDVGARHIRYSGAPLAFGFDEAGSEKSMTVVDLKAGGAEIRTVPFRPNRQVRSLTGAFSDLLAGTPSKDFIQAILADEVPLIDPMKRLRAIYPNACHLAYARQARAPEAKAFGAGRAATTPIEMIHDFIKVVRGREPNAEEVAIVGDKLHAAASGEEQT
ncbi:exonuclease SbcCD subunit D [Roseibaca sp. Y0-43]|uniref:exonuclease SbcCD subunit D n=1 Tax=Roseibaca sp. Y0-43 TaxID=2816854 RepID=UPI001D0C1163|nr:exonuclease SbcCD subunit D [Roseibaca sp. Y0-43]MCC1482403.1 exonuclease SbcCD subunit D [Roseibaca sp. Y0-43]